MECLVRYACARALGVLGESDIFPMLYKGLGSDRPYDRMYSNQGLKPLCGTDLTAFQDYKPIEDDMISGALIFHGSTPEQKARWKAKRWTAIADFTQWIKENREDYMLQAKE